MSGTNHNVDSATLMVRKVREFDERCEIRDAGKIATEYVILNNQKHQRPEKIFHAFTEANAFASWLPPYGFVATVHEMDVRVGGTFGCHFRISQRVIATPLAGTTWRLNPVSS